MKYGGVSHNTNAGSKKGIKTSYRCSVCNRDYKQDWTKSKHEKSCKEKQIADRIK